jgi:hypothetical protein
MLYSITLMSAYYDDNFGHWNDMDQEENLAFYRQVQKTNVWKVCSCCGRKVKIQPHYDKCNSCADKIEKGLDY